MWHLNHSRIGCYYIVKIPGIEKAENLSSVCSERHTILCYKKIQKIQNKGNKNWKILQQAYFFTEYQKHPTNQFNIDTKRELHSSVAVMIVIIDLSAYIEE